MDKKYQIFISSTYDDLKPERAAVVKAVLEMGHIPVGMEMFSAGDEEQWKIIQSHIDLSDYYVVVVAHRYGSVVDDVSYTEREYDYAIQVGVPVLGFIIAEGTKWEPKWVDTEPKAKQALETFKLKARKKPVDFWSDASELHGQVAIALMKQMNTRPRPGWVRGSMVSGPEVAAEISRLSSENAQLRAQIANARNFEEESRFINEDLRFYIDSTPLDKMPQIEMEFVGGWRLNFILEIENRGKRSHSPVPFQLAFITSRDVENCEIASDHEFRGSTVMTTGAIKEEFTHSPEDIFTLLPGAWQKRKITLCTDYEKPTAFPQSVTLRILSEAGTRDLPFSVMARRVD